MSDFMGKKVNMFLLLMIIVVLVGMGVVSIYFQHSFKTLNTQFENTTGILGTCQSELSQTNQALSTSQRSLNSTTTDIRKYDTLYEQKAAELETKKTDLSKAQAELNRVTVLKETYKRQVDEYYSKILSLNTTIKTLGQSIASLNSDVTRLQNRAECLRVKSDDQENTC